MHEASFGAIRKLAFFVHFFTAKRPGARGEFTPEMSANFFLCTLRVRQGKMQKMEQNHRENMQESKNEKVFLITKCTILLFPDTKIQKFAQYAPCYHRERLL